MIKKRIGPLLIMIALTVSTILTGCDDLREAASSKVKVYTNLFPLEDFTKKIGGPHVEVTNLIPPGVESHDFELSPKDMVALSKADLWIYHRVGMGGWVDKASRLLEENQTLIVDAVEKVKLLKVGDQFDPHVWLDPTIAKQQALTIYHALIKKDPIHQADYEKNYRQLIMELDRLDQEYQEMVQRAKRKEFITSHNAFAYLAHRYGLKQIPISGISPSDEPSVKELEQVIKEAKEHQAKYILFETLVSNKVAQVVKKELKAETFVLNPLEGLTKEEVAKGADYFSVMRKNKENLAKALGADPS